MKSFFKKTLVFLMTISMLLSCLPLQALATEQYTLEDRFRVQLSDDNWDFIDTGFPEIFLELRNENGNIVSTAKTKPDGTITFKVSSMDDIMSYKIIGDQPYTIIYTDMNTPPVIGDYNDFLFAPSLDENPSDMGIAKSIVGIEKQIGDIILTKNQTGDTSKKIANASYEFFYHGTDDYPLTTAKSIGTYITDVNGIIEITGLLCGNYSYKETNSPDTHFLNTTEGTFVIEEKKITNETTSDEAKCVVTLTKVDEDNENKLLSDVTFELYKKTNGDSYEKIGSYKTVNGKITVEDLHYGDYYFIETKTIDGYELDSTKYEFTLSGTKTTHDFVAKNTPWPLITFEKVDKDTGSEISNATFNIYTKDNVLVKEGLTGANFSTKLAPGDYYIKETITPKNYKTMSDYTFTVESKKNATHKLENEMYKTDIVVSKFIKGTNTYLSGAKFEFVGTNKNIEWTSNDKEYVLKDLIPGTYTLKETLVPDGYIGATDISIIIGENCETVKVTQDNVTEDIHVRDGKRVIDIYNTPIKLDINKLDSETEKNIIGSEFTLFKFNNTSGTYDIFDTFITNGQTKSYNTIPTGEYLLVEDVIPTGYKFGGVKNFTGLKEVSVKGDGIYFTIVDVENNELNVYNDRIYGSITINKSGKEFDSVSEKNIITNFTEFWFNLSENRPLAGAKFVLVAAEDIKDPADGEILITAGTQIGDEQTTSALGNVKFDTLLFGKYKVIETYAPNGYVKTTDNIEITINETNQNPTRDVINENETIEITVTKKDAKTGELLGNAVYGIYSVESNGLINKNTLIGTIKTDSTGTGTFKSCVPKGNYIVKELIAPDGYVLSEEVKTVDFSTSTGKVENKYAFEFKNNPITLEISKLDAEEIGSYVIGAKMQLINKETNTVYKEWTTDNSKYIITAIPAGKYILHETSSPVGYKIAQDIEIDVLAQEINTAEMKDERVKGSVTVTKTEPDKTTVISGVKFQLKDGDNVLNEGFTDINGQITFNNLPVAIYENGRIAGNKTYTIEEISVPDGYIILTESTNVTFDLVNNINEEINKKILIENDYTKLEISKIDTETKAMIAGATLSIYKASDFTDGNLNENAQAVKTWVSSATESFTVDRLPLGNYVLVEENTPDGYIKADDIKFALTNAGLVIILMEDDFTKVEFSKVDATTKEMLAGAILELYKAEDFVSGKLKEDAQYIDVWTTNAVSNHRIDRLPIGNYVLIETNAPDGYVKAEPLMFTVNATSEIQVIELVNEYTKVDISKLELGATEKKFVEGATLTLYRAEDINNDGTVKENVTYVDEWISISTPHRINRLPVGDYVLIETNAPDGYVYAENLKFTVKETSDVQNFEMYDDYTKVKLTKFEEGNERVLLAGAHLVVYKESDINADGTIKEGAKAYETWTSSGTESHMIYRMPAGNYVLKEIIAPNGYIIAENVPFTVFAVGEIQEVEMTDKYTKVEISKIDITTKDFVKDALLALYRAEDINADGTIKEGAVAFEKWITDNDSHKMYRVPIGNYVLVEQIVPDGYVKADNMNVVVQATADIQEFVMEDDYIKVEILKTEKGTNNFVEGATLGIFKPEDITSNGTVKENATSVATWTTVNNTHRINRLPAGDYVLVELNVPDGYVKADNIEFTVESISEIQTITMVDDYIKLDVIKTDITTKELIEGAELSIYYAKDIDTDGTINEDAEPVAKWISTTDAFNIIKIPAGNYVLVEDKAPDGYVKSENITFEVLAIETIQTVEMKNDYTKVDISKVELGSNNTILAGAEFIVYKSDDINNDGTIKNGAIIIDSWTSTTDAHRINRLPVGDYVLIETNAPIGYVKSENVRFTVTETANVLDVKVQNDYTKIEISKVDIETEKHIAGAELELYNANDINNDGTIKEGSTAVAKWTSTDVAYRIDKIAVGEYILIETSSPAGYIKAENMNISVKETGEIQSFIMKDDFTKVVINKLDIESKEFVSGSRLQLVDSENNIVAEWTTENKSYEINRLPIGTYTLIETSAPNGYLVADAMEIIVKATSDIQTFNMFDDFTKVEITKTDVETGKILAGAQLKLVDANGNTIEEWTSTTDAHRIDRLPVGTYKIVEISAPNGYLLNTVEVGIEVKAIADIQTFDIDNELDDYDVTISKIDATTKEELAGAKLIVTDKDGNTVDEWTSTNEPHMIKGMLPGVYTLTEITAPNGYYVAESITFELLKDGKTVDTKIVMENDYTKVSINKIKKGTDEFVVGAELHIEDKNGNIVVEKWITENCAKMIYGLPAGHYVLVEDKAPNGYLISENVEFEVTENGDIIVVTMEDEFVEEIPESPQTGDNSNISFYFFTMIASLICLVVLFVTKKKTENRV